MASAASSRTAPRARSSPASRSPYSPFRLPSSTAPAVPAARFPPAATTPASANWDAPEYPTRLSTHAWATLSPEATAAAPKASPEVPTASPSARPSRVACAGARAGARADVSVMTGRLRPARGRCLERYCAPPRPSRARW